jgi:putative DNA primase/helicase
MALQHHRHTADGRRAFEGIPGTASKPRPGIKNTSYIAYGSAIHEFQRAMQAAGLEPPDNLKPDRLHRFPGIGKRRGNTAGWCKLFADLRGGVYGDFSTGLFGTWQLGGGKVHIDEDTRREIEQERRKRQAEIEARHLKKAAESREIWGKAFLCTDHDYLIRKGVQAYGLRLGNWPKWIETANRWRRIVIPGALLVPMLDEAGRLWNLQGIFPEVHPELGRDKDFLGGRKAGLFHTLGAPSETLLIAEGYATAATVHEATGHQTFVAFDCGNLKAVAVTVRKRHPSAKIVVCADNDRFTDKPIKNPGITKAREAALAVGGFISIPQFPVGATGTDWNDLAQWRENHGGA